MTPSWSDVAVMALILLYSLAMFLAGAGYEREHLRLENLRDED